MGSSQSKHQKKIITVNHEKFTKVQSIVATDTIMLQIPIKNEVDYQQWQKKIQKLEGFDNQMYLFPLSFKFDPRTLCGDSGALSIQYDNYPFILLDEISNRKQIYKHFDESQMWYLLFCLVAASHFLSNLNSKVGDIQPKNIFINQMGQIKVSTVFSWPCEDDNLSKTEKYGLITYLAPQQLQMLRTKRMDTVLNFQISQCFSIGMTMLHAGLLHDMNNLYHPQSFTFDQRKFAQYLQEWKNLTYKNDKGNSKVSYSTQLKEAVLGLCEYSPHQRVSTSLLYSWMENYVDNIVNLKPFQIGKPPVKNLLGNSPKKYVQLTKTPRSFSQINLFENHLQKPNSIYHNNQFNTKQPSNPAVLGTNLSYPRNFLNQNISMKFNPHLQTENRGFIGQMGSSNQRFFSLHRHNERVQATSPFPKTMNFQYDQSRRLNKLY